MLHVVITRFDHYTMYTHTFQSVNLYSYCVHLKKGGGGGREADGNGEVGRKKTGSEDRAQLCGLL